LLATNSFAHEYPEQSAEGYERTKFRKFHRLIGKIIKIFLNKGNIPILLFQELKLVYHGPDIRGTI